MKSEESSRASSFFILHSTFFILHSTFFILHSTFDIRHSLNSHPPRHPLPLVPVHRAIHLIRSRLQIDVERGAVAAFERLRKRGVVAVPLDDEAVVLLPAVRDV